MDYDLIYDNLPVINVKYYVNEDPDEINDYRKYITPYPLLRTSLVLKCKNQKIRPGYYLLTPKNEKGLDFVMFKQQGKIIALIPVYEKSLIVPQLTYKKPPAPKVSMVAFPFVKLKKITKGTLKTIFKPVLKPPDLPETKMKASYVNGGKYFEIWLYVDKYLYKMLLKVEVN